MCVCVFTCVCLHVYMHFCGGQRTNPAIVLLAPSTPRSPILLESLTGLELIK